MTATVVDEETTLLQVGAPKRTPLDYGQLSIVLFLQLAEPLTSQVIYPFTPQLIRDIGITNGDETKVGHYVGLLQSLFFLTQAMTVLHWSRTSDRVGRKPVILIGLFGLSVSMYLFGLSKTFTGLVLSRALNGALNGNIGVIKSMMAEMTDETNIAVAYAYMPIAWSTGGTLGPIIGGALSHPAEQFPSIFGRFNLLKEYPYFLPCAVPATFSVLAWFVTYFYLKETSKVTQTWREYLGFGRKDETTLVDTIKVVDEIPESERPVPLNKLLIPRVLIAGLNYAFLSLVDISYRAIQPLFFSTPVALGGLGLPPSQIGTILSVFGVLNGIFQIFFFARIHDHFGSKKTFTVGIASCLPIFALFPLINLYAKAEGYSLMVWVLVGLQIVLSLLVSLSYGAVFIFISAASPNRASLGATNGLCQMSVSIMRAIGPAAANSLFSLSIKHNYLGGWMVYYVLLAVGGVALFIASLLPSRK
ncbi:major facilitator superfamily domain-containing protein [Schizophyllum amplum]|uniref:Major facilitator superfamily domain-containing protein n=1 Tax=Schizophyllum amplum TaxID=97359 RepID=A0A550CJV8_9AGAR|nr:major facilitator superfamily domain-containing protein [Auriculariopsis ampla]